MTHAEPSTVSATVTRNARGLRGARWRAASAAAALVAVAAAAPLGAAQLLDRVIAVVSGTVITLSDANAALAFGFVEAAPPADAVEAAMRWLVDRQLVLDDASRGGGGTAAQADVDREMAAIRTRFPGVPAFEEALARLGLDDAGTEAFVRSTLEAREYVARRFAAVAQPSDEDIRDYYARHLERFLRNGRQLDLLEATDAVRAALLQERREQATATWMDRLRRRADVVEVYRAAGR